VHQRLRTLFGQSITALHLQDRTVVWRYLSTRHWLDVWRTYLGPLAQAFARLDSSGQKSLTADLIALVQRFNRSDSDLMIVPCNYLEVVATKARG
jgi:hypothetical protein